MLIVIPVSITDDKLIKDFSEILNVFGPYLNHELLIVGRPSDILGGVRLFSTISHLFKKSEIYAFEADGERGWPEGPNFYWSQTIQYLKSKENTLPWLWMELDMTPLKHNWIDVLEAEYEKCNKYCMGWTQNTTTLTTSGKVIPLTKHLVGAAIYPPDISVCCTIWKHVDEIPTAFDVLCQWELVPETHHTTLFQHCFRTQNYKEIFPNIFKGEDNNDFPDDLRFDFPVNPDAVIHHGCDDGSLARVLTQKYSTTLFLDKE
jgi:hypothetical protein